MNENKQKYLEKDYKILYEYQDKDLIMYKANRSGTDVFYNVNELKVDLYFEYDELEKIINNIKEIRYNLGLEWPNRFSF